MNIAAFPKCYLDDIAHHRTMTVFDWIELAKQLDTEGLELYEGFLWSFDDAYLDAVRAALEEAGFAMPMLCCSPDFTNPSARERAAAIAREAEMIRVTRYLGGPGSACRVLSGQRYPEVTVEQGVQWVTEAIHELLPVARDNEVVLVLENHYKDGHWQYPEFAQKQEVFLRVLEAIPERTHFGVQYDPSNAIVAGDDPIALLRAVVDRVKTVHASDRYLSGGATLEDLRQSDGTLGYSPHLKHGVVGEGLNDYDTIFAILSEAGFGGWISIEDGMNGMEEMQHSLAFLKQMREKYPLKQVVPTEGVGP